MNRYSIRALAASGEVRHLVREGADENDVALEALREGLTPTAIVRQDGGLADVLNRPVSFGTRPRTAEVALFCEQMAAMASSGLTVEQALRVIARQGGGRHVAKTAGHLLRRVQAGAALSAALEAETGMPSYLGGMIRAAESGGRLAEGFEEASRYLRRQADTQSGMANALAYPAVVLVTVVLALTLVLTVVIPGFEPIFAGEEHRLPRITQAVLWLSDMAIHNGLHAALAALGLLAMAGGGLRLLPALRERIGRRMARAPVLCLPLELDAARVLGVMGMLFRSGVEVSEAVALASRAAAFRSLAADVRSASRRLREGASISAALSTVDALPDATRALIEVGEHTGELGSTTIRAAQLLEADASHRLERVVALANPLAIAVLGVAVGVVVGGVMLGILSINQLALRS